MIFLDPAIIILIVGFMNVEHKLLSKDIISRKGICAVCGSVGIKNKGGGRYVCAVKYRADRKKWYSTPNGRAYVRKHNGLSYRRHVAMECELCGLKATVKGLIDGHHKDENRKNNSKDNIQSLCPTCHRLTHLGMVHLVKRPDPCDKPHVAEDQTPIDLDAGACGLGATNQIKLLLDDIERLTNEVESEKAKVTRALEMDLDEKGKLGWRLYFKLKGEKGQKSEFDQTQSI